MVSVCSSLYLGLFSPSHQPREKLKASHAAHKQARRSQKKFTEYIIPRTCLTSLFRMLNQDDTLQIAIFIVQVLESQTKSPTGTTNQQTGFYNYISKVVQKKETAW